MLMKQGPIKPGTIREAIVFRRWRNIDQAKIIATILPVVAAINPEKVSDLVESYIGLASPSGDAVAKAQETANAMNEWISSGPLNVRQESGDMKSMLPDGWAETVKPDIIDRAVPKEWKGFIKAKYKNGRRNPKI